MVTASERWREHIDAHSSSGLTQQAYCERHGLHPKTFRTWRYRLSAVPHVALTLPVDIDGAEQGVEELAYPTPRPISGGAVSGSIAQRQSYSDEQRQRFVIVALQSGLSLERYARRMGITPSALHRWKHKFATRLVPTPGFTVAERNFAAVTIAEPPLASGPVAPTPRSASDPGSLVEITLRNGRHLSVDVHVDPQVLARLVAALDASP